MVKGINNWESFLSKESKSINEQFKWFWPLLPYEFDLDNEENINKYKNLPTTHYKIFSIDFREVPDDRYSLWLDILKHLSNKWEHIWQMNFKNIQVQGYNLYAILELSSKSHHLSFISWKGWHNLTFDTKFASIGFPNLSTILIKEWWILEGEFFKFIRILSKNESVRHNLKEIQVQMIDIYEHNFLFNWLKAKSYKFNQITSFINL